MIALVLDTETTGLIDNPARRLALQPEIISYASVNINTSENLLFGEYYRIFQPTKSINEEITKITGFTNEYLNNFHFIVDDIDEIVDQIQNASCIIGHNIKFDMNMIELECQRHGKTINWPQNIDLVQNSIYLQGYRLTLTDLHLKLFGTTFQSAHRADVDVQMTAKCALEMFKLGML